MNRCSVYIAVSADGYIAGPRGELDWLDAVQVEGEDYGYAAFFRSVDTLVIGRQTWEVARGFPSWPYAGKRVIVLTHRPAEMTHGEEIASGDVREVALGGRTYVDGGAAIRQFLDAGRVDDITLSIVPVLLGDGIRLFDRGLPPASLQLVDARSFPSGLVQLRYEVVAAAARSA
jgi:dihydrofolate reductase